MKLINYTFMEVLLLKMRRFSRRLMRAIRAPRRKKTKEECYADMMESVVMIALIIAIIVCIT